MLTSSSLFLLCFLPILLFLYYVMFRKVGIKANNFLLLLASLAFFALTDPFLMVLVLLLSVVNLLAAKRLVLASNHGQDTQNGRTRGRRWLLSGMLLLNLFAVLLYYLVPQLFAVLWAQKDLFYRAIPLVLLLYLLHAGSLLLSAYRKEPAATASTSTLLLYLLFFPVYTAGPVLSLQNFVQQAENRPKDRKLFASGVGDLVIGLAKVIVLGQALSYPAKTAFQSTPEITASFAVFGVICFILQVYYELSGYCQMAKGVAALFGFHLPDSFLHPFFSTSFTEFLSKFNRSISVVVTDTVFCNAKGSFSNALLTALTMSALFAAYFGVGWNYFCLVGILLLSLLAEQFLMHYFTSKSKWINFLLHFCIFIPVLLLFFVFAGTSTPWDAWHFMRLLLGFETGHYNVTSGTMFLREYWLYYLAAGLGIIPMRKLARRLEQTKIYPALFVIALTVLLVLCILSFSTGVYQPFFA